MDYQASASSPTPNSALSSTTSTLESSTQGASKISWFVWIVIILVLAFFGFNVFSYLAKGTEGLSGFLGNFIETVGTAIAKVLEFIGDLFKKIARILGFGVGGVIKTTTEATAAEAKSGIDEVSNTIVGAISLGQRQGQRQGQGQEQSTTVSSTLPQQNPEQEQSLHQSLNQSLNQQKQSPSQKNADKEDYYAEDSNSSIHSSKLSSKSGWCFIGEDRGFRSCIQVNQNDKCMSGDIFPSQEICINPNLRS